MIGKLTGIVDSIKQECIILDVGGVGYLVHTHHYVLNQFSTGDMASLYIETLVKEQDISLFGFNTEDEKEWFKNLISVQGVGAKLAIAILGAFRTNDLQNAIITEDKLKFQSISGVGGKIATRIINELKNKIKTIKELNIVNAQLNRVDCDIHQKQALDDAIEALVGLGFSKSDAMKRIAGIDTNNKDFTLESLIKQALKSNIH
ncbi:Holliday junction branch migration protein RuvA [Candidatus Lariskella endosymbiont of Epinotia ramella]|uniref:Holliday junction branch migration protein RuvA n=1 Tax=Candidatus Lariskella endosymbiont of Epinotia ramella TaxID=3066224 RepID=UPI0030D5FBC7